jgi:hypothetical protein
VLSWPYRPLRLASHPGSCTSRLSPPTSDGHSSCGPPGLLYCFSCPRRDTWLLSQAQAVALALHLSAAAVSLATSTAQPHSFRLPLHLPPSLLCSAAAIPCSSGDVETPSRCLKAGRWGVWSSVLARAQAQASSPPAVLKYRLIQRPGVGLFSNTPSLTLRPRVPESLVPTPRKPLAIVLGPLQRRPSGHG